MTCCAENIKVSREKYDSYDANLWEKSYFDDNTGGYLVIEKVRIEQSKKSKNERKKFEKEHEMCITLAKAGCAVEYLDDKQGDSHDIRLNGIKADLKKTGSHNNIVNYAKEAVRKQGADMVIFEFEKETVKIYAELERMKMYRIQGKYYFTGKECAIYEF